MDAVQSPVRRGAAHGRVVDTASRAVAPRPSPAPRRRCQSRWRLQWGSASFRFTMLVLSMFAVSSGYFSYDLPSITSAELKSSGLVKNNQELGLLFSVYAAPNAIAPLLSGFWFAHVGVWRGVLSIAAVITTGITVVAAGVAVGSYPLLVAGRALYGLAGESLFVGVDVLITAWFREAELGLSYGLIQAAGQGGSFAAFYVAPWMSRLLGGAKPVYALAALVSATATALLVTAMYLERDSVKPHDDDEEGEEEGQGGSAENGSLSAIAAATAPQHSSKVSRLTDDDGDDDDDEQGEAHSESQHLLRRRDAHSSNNSSGSDSTSKVHSGPLAPTPALSGGAESSSASAASSDAALAAASATPAPSSGTGGSRAGAVWHVIAQSRVGRVLGFDHLAALHSEFWLVFVGIVSYSTCFYCLLAFANDWLQSEFGMSASQSGRMAGVISILSCIVSPISGLLMDRYGYRPVAALVAMASACIAFGLMGFAPIPISLCLALGGTAYSVLPSALYPMIAETVSEESFTVVYAMTAGAVNLLLAVAFYAAGWMSESGPLDAEGLFDDSAVAGGAAAGVVSGGGGIGEEEGAAPNYRMVFLMFVLVSGVGTVAMCMLVYDRWRKGGLQFYEVENVIEGGSSTSGGGSGGASGSGGSGGSRAAVGSPGTDTDAGNAGFSSGGVGRGAEDRAALLGGAGSGGADGGSTRVVGAATVTASAEATATPPSVPDSIAAPVQPQREPSYAERRRTLLRGVGAAERHASRRVGLPAGPAADAWARATATATATATASVAQPAAGSSATGTATVAPLVLPPGRHLVRSRPIAIPGAGTGQAQAQQRWEWGGTAPSLVLPPATAAAGGVRGPLLLADNKAYHVGVPTAERVGHTMPLQVMDARRRTGHKRPLVFYEAPRAGHSTHAQLRAEADEYWHVPRASHSVHNADNAAAGSGSRAQARSSAASLPPIALTSPLWLQPEGPDAARYVALASRSPPVPVTNRGLWQRQLQEAEGLHSAAGAVGVDGLHAQRLHAPHASI